MLDEQIIFSGVLEAMFLKVNNSSPIQSKALDTDSDEPVEVPTASSQPKYCTYFILL